MAVFAHHVIQTKEDLKARETTQAISTVVPALVAGRDCPQDDWQLCCSLRLHEEYRKIIPEEGGNKGHGREDGSKRSSQRIFEGGGICALINCLV